MTDVVQEKIKSFGARFKLSLQGKILWADITDTRSKPEASYTTGTYDFNNTKSFHLKPHDERMGIGHEESLYIRIGLKDRIEIIHPVLGVLEILDSDDKARAYGLTPEKLVRVLLAGINPTLALDEDSFIDFLGHDTCQEECQPNPCKIEFDERQSAQKNRQSRINDDDSGSLPEQPGLTGLSVCLNFADASEFKSWTRSLTAERVATSVTKALKSNKLVKEALLILLKYMTYLAMIEEKYDQEQALREKRTKITKFLTAIIGLQDSWDNFLYKCEDMVQERFRLQETILKRSDDFQHIIVDLQTCAHNDCISLASQSEESWKMCSEQYAMFSATATKAIEELQFIWFTEVHDSGHASWIKNLEKIKDKTAAKPFTSSPIYPVTQEAPANNKRKSENRPRIVFHSKTRGAKDRRRVLVINTTTDNVEYAKWIAIANLVMSDAYVKTDLKPAIEKLPCVIEVIDQSNLDEDDLDELHKTAISSPPAFVNDDCKPDIMTDPLGIKSSEYVKTIKEIFQTLTAPKITEAQGKAAKRTELITAIATVIANFLDTVFVATKSGHQDDVTYNLRTRKSTDMKLSKTGKNGLKHQLTITLATIFTCIKDKSKYELHGRLAWTFDRMYPKMKKLVDIKVDAEMPSSIDIVIILNSKKSQRDIQEARILMGEKLLTIGNAEVAKITVEEDKKSYTTQVLPEVKKYVEKHFKNTLRKDDASGITAIRSVLTSISAASRILEILTFLHDEASRAMDMKALTEVLDDNNSDGEDVILPVCNHKVKLIEPPSFSEACRTVHKFSPPTYLEEKHGDFIDFIEGTAMAYIRKFPSMSYADKGIAIWWLFRSDRQKNMYMKYFGKFLNDISINSDKEFQNLYVQVSKKMFPEQIKTPLYYQDLLNDPQWLLQRDGEVFDELLERLKDCLENAFPNEHTSDVNRVRLADTFYRALNNRFYQKYIDEHHYEDFFYKGKMNHVITQLNKKKKIRMEQKRRNEHHVTSVKIINREDDDTGDRSDSDDENDQNFLYNAKTRVG